jgi:hypothetical protein
MHNVLVFPCGSEIGLEIHRALLFSKHFRVFGASSVDDHGKFVYEKYIPDVPLVSDPGFIGALNQIITANNIDFIIPAHDDVVLFLSSNRCNIRAEIVTSDAETCHICRSKKSTYAVFHDILPTPNILDGSAIHSFPLFLKPDIGQGSKGTQLVRSKEELDFFINRDSSLLIMEYLPGKEYTIDCFTNRHGQLLFSEGRERVRISNGISVSSKEVNHPILKEFAQRINSHLNLRGAWFYQVKERANGEFVLLEIAPRIAGSMAFFRVNGMNFVQMSLFDCLGIDVEVVYNSNLTYADRALTTRYSLQYKYEVVYVDLDDTLIVEGKVNADLIKFLYQSRNQNIKIVLLTRHAGDVGTTLTQFSITVNLFHEIVVLKKQEPKSKYIVSHAAIFIDDSFAERKEVATNCGIPVFGLDSIELLFAPYW